MTVIVTFQSKEIDMPKKKIVYLAVDRHLVARLNHKRTGDYTSDWCNRLKNDICHRILHPPCVNVQEALYQKSHTTPDVTVVFIDFDTEQEDRARRCLHRLRDVEGITTPILIVHYRKLEPSLEVDTSCFDGIVRIINSKDPRTIFDTLRDLLEP
jgi:hypothetical protein